MTVPIFIKKAAAVGILIIILGALLWWYFFLQQSAPGTTAPTQNKGFFPFGIGGGAGGSAPGGASATTTPGGQSQAPLPRLRLISSVPVAGATTLIDQKTGETLIRYVERATGHVFETTTASPTARRLTNTTVPKVTEALFVEEGNAVILRYLKDDTDTVENFYGKILPGGEESGVTKEAQLQGVFLAENITRIAVSPDTKKIFYLTENKDGSLGTIVNPDGTKKIELLVSPIAEWLPLWPDQKTIALTTAPASAVEGYLYFLNASSGTLDPLLQKILALTTLTNPATHAVLFSRNNAGNNLSLHLYAPVERKTTVLSVATFPEKCAWSSISPDVLYCAVPKGLVAGEYPDLWYQGVASFADALWKINTKTGETTLLSGLDEKAHEKTDVINPFLDKNERFFFFTNKNDSTLWSLRLGE